MKLFVFFPVPNPGGKADKQPFRICFSASQSRLLFHLWNVCLVELSIFWWNCSSFDWSFQEKFFFWISIRIFFLTILLGDGYCWKLSWRCIDTRAIEQASHMVWYLFWTLQQASMQMRSSFLLAFSRREFVLTEDSPYFLKRRCLCQSPISNNPILI